MRIGRIRIAPTLVIVAAMLGWGTFLAAFSLYRHITFNSGAWDLGIFDQLLWNSAHGRLFWNTLSTPNHFLGQHFSPLVLVFVPIYWLGGGTREILVIQAFLLVLPACILLWYAHVRLRSAWAMPLVPLLYLLHPTLAASATFDFRQVALGPLLLSLSLAGLLLRRHLLFVIPAIGLLLLREDLGIVVAGCGLWAMWRNRWFWTGLGLTIGGLAVTALAVLVIAPYFAGGSEYQYFYRYGDLGSDAGGLFSTALHDPGRVLASLVTPRKLWFLLEMLGSFAGLPLLAPGTALLALPHLAYLLPGNYRALTELMAHYPLLLLPPLAFAAIDGQARFGRFVAGRTWAGRPLLTGVLALGVLVWSGWFLIPRYSDLLPRRLNNGLASQPEHLRAVTAMLGRIPLGAPVSAQTGLVPHLSHREQIYLFPDFEDADWIALDLHGQRYVGGSMSYEDGLSEIVCDQQQYRLLYEQDGVLLFHREQRKIPRLTALPPGVPSMHIPIGERIELVGSVIHRQTVRRQELVPVTLYWRSKSKPRRNWTVFTHLVDHTGTVRAQYDAPPGCGDAPTTGWQAGTIIEDTYYLIPQKGQPAGEYKLMVGMYDPGTGQRAATGQLGDELDLGTVEVLP